MAKGRDIDSLIKLADIGERVVEAVRESGLLKVKRRAARKAKGRGGTKRAAKPAVSKGVSESLPATEKVDTSSLKVPQPRKARAGADGAAKGTVAEE